MKESIYTIPVSEVFEPKDHCPICNMRDILEHRCVEYIMGAAMMEPDVREETNRLGFCENHFKMMLKKKNRLSIALILESHLNEVRKEVEKGIDIKKPKERAKQKDTCYVCSQIDWAMDRMLYTTVNLWVKEQSFKDLFAAQPKLCLPHYKKLCEVATDKLNKKDAVSFKNAATKLTLEYLDTLQGDVSHFCKMFDYRNSSPNADWGNSRDSIERAIWYLTSRLTSEPENK